MQPILEIFSQGEELVTGQIVDSNAAWLSQQAIELGFRVSRHTAVGDKLPDLISLLKEIANRADCCLCTGGLGPTGDDLTAQAVAAAFNLELEFDPVAYAQMAEFFKSRGRTMPDTNRKQALLPHGSLRLDNEWGTAPGFALQYGRCWFAFLPGVPFEMQQMYIHKVLPQLKTQFRLNPSVLISLKTLGLGESELQHRLQAIEIPEAVELGYRAGEGEVQVKLLFPPDYELAARQRLIDAFTAVIGDAVFAIAGPNHAKAGDLISTIDELMTAGGFGLAVLETASQGRISSCCRGKPWLVESLYRKSLVDSFSPTAEDEYLTTALELLNANITATADQLVLAQFYWGTEEIFADAAKAIKVLSLLQVPDGSLYQAVHTVAGPEARKQKHSALLTLDLLRRYLQNKLS